MRYILFLIVVLSYESLWAAPPPDPKRVIGIAFYHCEQLYDNTDDFGVNDEDYTPEGKFHYTDKIYQSRLHNLAKVILSMDDDADGHLALLGLSDVEDEKVLQDLCTKQNLGADAWAYVISKGPDRWGMNVALLYKPGLFTVLESQSLALPQPDAFELNLVRDIIYIKGLLLKDTVYIWVNYWNSTHINDPNAGAKQALSASFCRKQMDAVLAKQPNARLIVMGNFNTNPNDSSLSKVLKTAAAKEDTGPGQLYNPFSEMLQSGKGSVEFLDKWYIYDQIMLSGAFLKPFNPLFYTRAFIFKKDYMADANKRFLGYPLAAFAGTQYIKGFSDHFPVMVYLSALIK